MWIPIPIVPRGPDALVAPPAIDLRVIGKLTNVLQNGALLTNLPGARFLSRYPGATTLPAPAACAAAVRASMIQLHDAGGPERG